MTTVAKPRKWFDFDALEGVECGVGASTGAEPVVFSPYPEGPSDLVYVERRTGDFCGCCGLFNRRTETMYDEFGRARTKTLCGIGLLNWIGFVIYVVIIVCAVLLLWSTTLV
tara:strand:- start:1268 stop:1603 length:336 start_codon:yes stop_codon:yes gene_type:complete